MDEHKKKDEKEFINFWNFVMVLLFRKVFRRRPTSNEGRSGRVGKADNSQSSLINFGAFVDE